MGQCISAYDTCILGIDASLKADLQHERVRELAPTTVDMFEVKLIETKVIVADGFTGPGVAVPSEEGKNAARLFASLEEVYC